MAEAGDGFEDLDDLCGDCDELTERFSKAASHLQTLLPKVDNETLLMLYGYYKQATEGPCNVPKPGFFDMRGKAKWEAWNKLGNLDKSEAKAFYINKIEALDQSFKASCSSGGDGQDKSTGSWVKVSIMQSGDAHLEESDKTIVDYVKEGNDKKVAHLLQESASAIDFIDKDGLGLIHWAADRGSISMLKLLVEKGINVYTKDIDGQTALHYAASCGHEDCVEFLLEKGCDPEANDLDGVTPINLASDKHIKKILTMKAKFS